MNRGGERVEREGDENTGWESVAALASQAPDKSQELSGDSENEDEKVKSAELLGKALQREVFEKVNQHRVERVVNRVLDRVDGGILLELQDRISSDIEDGVRLATDYYVNILGLERIPSVSEGELKDETLAKCIVSLDMRHDAQIVYDEKKVNESGDDLLSTLGHEFWHAWQNQEIRRDAKNGRSWEGMLYFYNYANYVSGTDDYAMYRGQLVEVEAYEFEKGIAQKIKDAKLGRFIEGHSEIYGEENMVGIEQELQGVFRGFEVDDFLEKVGAAKVEEFFEKIINSEDNKTDIENLASRYVDYLTDLVGVKKRMRVRLETKENLGKAGLKAVLVDNVGIDEMEVFSDMLMIRDEILLDRGKSDYSDVFLSTMPRLVWQLRQNELMKDNPDNERAKLYAANKANFVTERYDSRLAKDQLLVREKDEFADTLMGILDEQTTIEEVKQMPLPKKVLAKLYMIRKDILPLSKKYQVKRSR